MCIALLACCVCFFERHLLPVASPPFIYLRTVGDVIARSQATISIAANLSTLAGAYFEFQLMLRIQRKQREWQQQQQQQRRRHKRPSDNVRGTVPMGVQRGSLCFSVSGKATSIPHGCLLALLLSPTH